MINQIVGLCVSNKFLVFTARVGESLTTVGKHETPLVEAHDALCPRRDT
jgi:hypothetical protein